MIIARLLIAIFVALALAAPAGAEPPSVRLQAGALRGADQGAVDAFLGIPYAAPPVGPNRWRAPQPAAPWQGVRGAAAFGHACWQGVTPEGFGPWSHEYVVQGDVSEDCLYLNVWTPADRDPDAALPVLVWIHGGGFNSGSGSIPIYDGRALAERGIVVVTINYRVGVFGFLAHPELTTEAGAAPAANFGLQDMIAALRWVRANIVAFGGNPAAVTIAGQSAGAMAVHDLLAAPPARGLFARAIAESGLPGTRTPPPLAAAEADGLAFAREKGAASLAALRAMPAEALQPSSGGNAIRFVPVIDGMVLTEAPQQALAAGRSADVPMLAGFTADEGTGLGQGYGSSDAEALAALLRDSFGPVADRLAPFYAATGEAERARANVQVRRDRALGALDQWARSRAGRAPVYGYRFSHVQPGPETERWRAFHSSEIPYVFRTFDAAPERGWTEADRALADRVSSYWINFVRTGDPNGPGLPAWPRYDARDPTILDIGDPIAARPLLPPEKLELIRAVGEEGRLSIF